MGQEIASVNNEQQAIFFEVLLETGSVVKASEVAGYANPSYGYKLARKMRKDILDRIETELAVSGPKAAKILVGALEADNEVSSSQMMASNQILDRIGIVKKNQIEVTAKIEHNVTVFLPEKDEVQIIDIEADE